MLSINDVKELENLANENRKNVVEMVYNAKSGHIGGSLSAADIMTVLFHKCMKNVPVNLKDYNSRDRFVLSKGHVSPVYYSVLSQLGFLPKEELLSFRKLGTRLQGHPTLLCPGVEVCTGSLGQGLSLSCGIAVALKLDNNPAHVYALLGDGELQEGNVWEAFMQAPQRNLDNLTVIIDRNNLQIDGCTENIKALEPLDDKLKAFNWKVINIDGHNIQEIFSAIEQAKSDKSPTAIIANTIKGKGVSFMENSAGWHGKSPNAEEYALAMKELMR